MEVHKIRVDSDSTKQSDESFNLFYSKTTPKQKCTSLLLLKRTFLSFLNHFFFLRFSIYLPSSRNFIPGNLQLLTLPDLSLTSFLAASPRHGHPWAVGNAGSTG